MNRKKIGSVIIFPSWQSQKEKYEYFATNSFTLKKLPYFPNLCTKEKFPHISVEFGKFLSSFLLFGQFLKTRHQ
jgi:hypothetical protein